VMTDDRGRFAFDDIVGDEYVIASFGHQASKWEHAPTAAGQRAEVQLVVGPAGNAGGGGGERGHAGAPRRGWVEQFVERHRIVVPGTSTQTDDAGRFSLDVRRGDFVLSVRHDKDDDFDDADDVKVAGGTHDVRLVLP